MEHPSALISRPIEGSMNFAMGAMCALLLCVSLRAGENTSDDAGLVLKKGLGSYIKLVVAVPVILLPKSDLNDAFHELQAAQRKLNRMGESSAFTSAQRVIVEKRREEVETLLDKHPLRILGARGNSLLHGATKVLGAYLIFDGLRDLWEIVYIDLAPKPATDLLLPHAEREEVHTTRGQRE